MKSTTRRSAAISLASRGMALLSALISLVVLSAVVLTLTRTVLSRVREAENYQNQLQADALAESAIARARVLASANPAWSGDVWSPEVPGHSQMRAETLLEPAQHPERLRVICVVPANSPNPVRLERTVPWTTAPNRTGETP